MKYLKSALFFYLILNMLTIQCLSENDIPNNEEEQERISLKDYTIFNALIRTIDPEFNQTIECIRDQILQNKLDPFKIPIIPLIFKNNAVESNLTITNFQLHGLSSFEVLDAYLNTNLLNLFVHLSFKFENLAINFTEYKGFIKLMDKIHLYGDGSFAANFTDFDLDVKVNFKLKSIFNPYRGILLKKIEFTMNLFKTKIDITGLFNDPIMSELISKQLSEALTRIAAQEKERINTFIEDKANDFVDDVINPILRTMNLYDLIDIYEQLPSCQSTVATYINRGINLIPSLINSYPEFNIEDYLSQVYDYYYYHLN